MHHISQNNYASREVRGGRSSSPELRYSLEQCQDFAGLEEGVKPYDLLNLVKRAGKSLGFRKNMIELLDYYMRFTREEDWQQGSRAIVFQSLSKTAMDLGMCERHVRRIEQELFKIGAISWNDSGNHKRYGQRDPDSGHIIFAFGVDLTPLAYLKDDLENALHEQELYKKAWGDTKRQISWYRSQIRGIIAEIEGQGGDVRDLVRRYDEIATRISASMSLESLRALHGKHKAAYDDIITLTSANDKKENNKESSKADSNDRHYKYPINLKNNKLFSSPSANGFQESCSQTSKDQTDPLEQEESPAKGGGSAPEKAGLAHITGKQMLNAASQRFKDHIPLSNRAMSIDDLVEAAYQVRKIHGISQKSWALAVQTLGRPGAAVCVLLTDHATLREESPVTKPAAYFVAMIKRAGVGELHLHKSIMGILRREQDLPAVNENHKTIQSERG